jgi:serine/threonine protein phosphatase 1
VAPQDERFARLGQARRVWAVAAVHGEAARLAALHDRLETRLQPGDRLVYLGNLLGHGAEVRATLDEALAFRLAVIARRRAFAADVVFLRGSQEEMWQKLLQLQFASNPREVLEWMVAQGIEPTLKAFGGDPRQGFAAIREGPMALTRWTGTLRAVLDAGGGYRQYMTALRRAASTEDGLLFVHSGIDPARPLDAQKDAFWWGGGPGFLELGEPYGGFGRIIRGFDRRHPGLVEAAYATSLDGGCGFGGELLAACFDAGGHVVDRLAA